MGIMTEVLCRWQLICEQRAKRFKDCCMDTAAEYWMGKAQVLKIVASMRTKNLKKGLTYISGPITGVEGFKDNFEHFEQLLRSKGFKPFNPCKLGTSDLEKWEDYMRRDIVALMECKNLFIMPGWGKSKGAKVEVQLARDLNIPMFTVTFVNHLKAEAGPE